MGPEELLVAAALVLLGLVIGRWWAMLLPLVPAVVFAALVATTSFGDGLRETSDGDERGLAAYLMIVGAIASTVLVTLGVGLRKLLRHQTRVAEHEPPRQHEGT